MFVPCWPQPERSIRQRSQANRSSWAVTVYKAGRVRRQVRAAYLANGFQAWAATLESDSIFLVRRETQCQSFQAV